MSIYIETKLLIDNLETTLTDAGKQISVLANIIKNIPIEDIKNNIIELNTISTNIFNYVDNHYHIEHCHGKCHSFKEDDNLEILCQKNMPIYPIFIDPDTPLTAFSVLIKEFEDWIDYDMNNLIFGKDFLFNYDDINVPLEIKRLQSNVKIYNISILTWNEYLNSCSPEFNWNLNKNNLNKII